jgi:hypothetical protein
MEVKAKVQITGIIRIVKVLPIEVVSGPAHEVPVRGQSSPPLSYQRIAFFGHTMSVKPYFDPDFKSVVRGS